jgi:hypothetical protein
MTKTRLNDEIKSTEFKMQLEELLFITRRLKGRGSLIFLILILSIAMCSIEVFLHISALKEASSRGFKSFDKEFQESALFIGIILLLVYGTLLLYTFTNLRKRGAIIFDELTEEIDWSNKRKEYIYKPPIETRIIIKEFLRSGDLPFTTGVGGQTFYLVSFIILLISSIILNAI